MSDNNPAFSFNAAQGQQQQPQQPQQPQGQPPIMGGGPQGGAPSFNFNFQTVGGPTVTTRGSRGGVITSVNTNLSQLQEALRLTQSERVVFETKLDGSLPVLLQLLDAVARGAGTGGLTISEEDCAQFAKLEVTLKGLPAQQQQFQPQGFGGFQAQAQPQWPQQPQGAQGPGGQWPQQGGGFGNGFGGGFG